MLFQVKAITCYSALVERHDIEGGVLFLKEKMESKEKRAVVCPALGINAEDRSPLGCAVTVILRE